MDQCFKKILNSSKNFACFYLCFFHIYKQIKLISKCDNGLTNYNTTKMLTSNLYYTWRKEQLQVWIFYI